MTAARSLLSAEQATTLLERVLLEQVMEQVDLDGLLNVRDSLESAIAELAPRPAREPAGPNSVLVETAAEIASDAAIDAQIEAMTDEMMTRTLQRISTEAMRYLRAAVELEDEDCPLCEDAACSGAACIVPAYVGPSRSGPSRSGSSRGAPARIEIVRPKPGSARNASRGAR